LNTILKEK